MSDDPTYQNQYADGMCACSERRPMSHRLPSGKWCFLLASGRRPRREREA